MYLFDVLSVVPSVMQVKCHQYWPNPGNSATYGGFSVTCHTEEGNAAFLVREMTLTHTQVAHTDTHTHTHTLSGNTHTLSGNTHTFPGNISTLSGNPHTHTDTKQKFHKEMSSLCATHTHTRTQTVLSMHVT